MFEGGGGGFPRQRQRFRLKKTFFFMRGPFLFFFFLLFNSCESTTEREESEESEGSFASWGFLCKIPTFYECSDEASRRLFSFASFCLFLADGNSFALCPSCEIDSSDRLVLDEGGGCSKEKQEESPRRVSITRKKAREKESDAPGGEAANKRRKESERDGRLVSRRKEVCMQWARVKKTRAVSRGGKGGEEEVSSFSPGDSGRVFEAFSVSSLRGRSVRCFAFLLVSAKFLLGDWRRRRTYRRTRLSLSRWRKKGRRLRVLIGLQCGGEVEERSLRVPSLSEKKRRRGRIIQTNRERERERARSEEGGTGGGQSVTPCMRAYTLRKAPGVCTVVVFE